MGKYKILNEKIDQLLKIVQRLECSHDVRDLCFVPESYTGRTPKEWAKMCRCGKEFGRVYGEAAYLKAKRGLMLEIIKADTERLYKLEGR